ncbi:MAG TPA: hypothetical protein VMQ51_07110 [Candidatus Binatia bacterium]|nr:hypothetical protein [Candidatus Binatia bacterium]
MSLSHTRVYMGAYGGPRAARTLPDRPRYVCTHPNRHEFYNWRSYRAAVAERNAMANNPHYASLFVSEVHRGTLGGWAWTVCWQCGREPRASG